MRTVVQYCPECDAQFRPRIDLMRHALNPDYLTCAACGKRVNIHDLKIGKPIYGFLGGQAPGSSAPASKFAITGFGTNSGTNSGTTGTIAASVTKATNEYFVAVMAYDNTNGPTDSIKIGSTVLTANAPATLSFGAAAELDTFVRFQAASLSGALTFDATSAGTIPEWVAAWMTISGTTSQAVDKGVSAAGNDTNPDSGLTALTTAAQEFLVGIVATNGGSIGGSWNYGFTGLTEVSSTNFSLGIATKSVFATGTYAAGKSGAASLPWCAAVIAIR